jgi:hypothetical protein
VISRAFASTGSPSGSPDSVLEKLTRAVKIVLRCIRPPPSLTHVWRVKPPFLELLQHFMKSWFQIAQLGSVRLSASRLFRFPEHRTCRHEKLTRAVKIVLRCIRPPPSLTHVWRVKPPFLELLQHFMKSWVQIAQLGSVRLSASRLVHFPEHRTCRHPHTLLGRNGWVRPFPIVNSRSCLTYHKLAKFHLS